MQILLGTSLKRHMWKAPDLKDGGETLPDGPGLPHFRLKHLREMQMRFFDQGLEILRPRGRGHPLGPSSQNCKKPTKLIVFIVLRVPRSLFELSLS